MKQKKSQLTLIEATKNNEWSLCLAIPTKYICDMKETYQQKAKTFQTKLLYQFNYQIDTNDQRILQCPKPMDYPE